MKARFTLPGLGVLILLGGCASGSTSTNEDVTASAASIDASKRGVEPQPDTDLTQAGGGTAAKPHR